ncbi:YkgJ family cysteine cluster protein [Dethiosulfatarculus sandiegensis]|uniref:Fe-S oxidoreductase n=1 Tax=Dethiosulfatarculus sandiegensis TaxID=1429043 RepID=A0A0D2JBT4_9BACT|nr:YkgJ family cysteine cluster protein [Dethiosulfatarculus sandiegensis]KIX15604.1 hypothetical protein X474_02665 [Dethiosulfatarculus sandiegensis]
MTQEKKALTLEDHFCFACHSGLECYTSCCRDVNIFLTPNDVIRMKTALEMTSTEFLKKYTDVVVVPDRHLPLVQLRMNTEDNNKCFFVRPHGCLIYAHRPWACRMFPLDEAGAGGFSVIATGDRCHGLVKGDDWQVKSWLKDQGATQSKESDGSYDALAAHEFMRKLDIENQQILNMIITALYDVDGFRKLIFESSFLDKFELDQERIDICRTEDVAMLDLGFDWVKFGLLGQKTLTVKESAIKAAKEAG